MSSDNHTPERKPSNGYPSFDLEYYLDIDESPSRLTICSADSSGSLATEWITIELKHAVPIDTIR